MSRPLHSLLSSLLSAGSEPSPSQGPAPPSNLSYLDGGSPSTQMDRTTSSLIRDSTVYEVRGTIVCDMNGTS